jgi:sugar phosphate isomerase/epimerase
LDEQVGWPQVMTKPKLGLSMLYCLGESFKRMTFEIPKAGTAYVEIVDDGLHVLNKKRTAMLNEIGRSCGIKYTVHAPFAGINIALPSKPLLHATMKRLKESIVNASAIDCQMWVFHPGMKTGISMFYPGADWVRNLEGVRLLTRFADDLHVKISIENVMNPFVLKSVQEFKRFYKEVDEDIGLALDTGHANLIGQLGSFLTEFPDKIVHIHAHDNLGKEDQHLGIGYGNIDWNMVSALLKKAGYDKVVVVESGERVEASVQKLKQLLLS